MWRLVSVGFLVFTVLLAGAVMAQEAAETPEASSPTLVGFTWQWEHFADGEQEIEVPPADYTITFIDEERFQAKADCNIVLGTYNAEAWTISFLPGPMTLAACLPESLGSDFVRYLGQVAVYSFTEDGKLLLEAPADSGTLTFSAQPQVTGSVTYLQRIALPDDAIVRVQIQDVSIADAPTTIIAEQIISTDGAQVPIPFTVSYPASAIQENHQYSLSARITDGEGRLLFISDIATPVIADANPTSDIELVLVKVGA